jgi:hypothetical protein
VSYYKGVNGFFPNGLDAGVGSVGTNGLITLTRTQSATLWLLRLDLMRLLAARLFSFTGPSYPIFLSFTTGNGTNLESYSEVGLARVHPCYPNRFKLDRSTTTTG